MTIEEFKKSSLKKERWHIRLLVFLRIVIYNVTRVNYRARGKVSYFYRIEKDINKLNILTYPFMVLAIIYTIVRAGITASWIESVKWFHTIF